MLRYLLSFILLICLLLPASIVSSEAYVQTSNQQKDVTVYITKTGK